MVDGLQKAYEGRIDFMVYPDMDRNAAAGDFANEQGVEYVPTSVLVGADGTELDRWVGSQSGPELSAAFEAALVR